MTSEPFRPQVKPRAEGWTQAVDAEGRPKLQFAQSKRVKQPPQHLADMTLDERIAKAKEMGIPCLLYTSPSPRDRSLSRMPSSA